MLPGTEGEAMTSQTKAPLIAPWIVLAGADVALAGMPSITLSDLARMRLQTISFFLLGLLLSAWAVRLIWNGLARDIPRMPRLSFGRALALVALWGLLFVLVLTMISGARELMTPGAWEKDGFTYKLANPSQGPGDGDDDEARRQGLDRLRVALWTHARGHDSRFPLDEESAMIPEEAWRVPGRSGMRYRYLPGRVADEGQHVLAIEPAIFGEEQLVLLTDGRIVSMTPAELSRSIPGEVDP
jgi:hypothetical protein